MNNINLGAGILLFKDLTTGEELSLATENVELSCESTYSSDTLPNHFNTVSTELTFVGHIDPRTLLSIMTGQHITNNWLKMHGVIMTRKGKGRKRKNNKNEN